MINITKIYLVENCYNDPNKVYIGKTISSREAAHKFTYGPNIIYSIIDEVNSLDRKDWELLETYWMEQFKTWGFEVVNKRKKGGGGLEFSPFKGIPNPSHSLKMKGKISLLRKRSRIYKGRKSPHIGKPIIQCDIYGNYIREWTSAAEVSKTLYINESFINKTCRGLYSSAKGYIWKYKL
jgi:hypothetical protein